MPSSLHEVRVRYAVVLLVVCVDDATAQWAARPIELGPPGSRTVPMFLGPERVPVVTETAQAARLPLLAVLSAAHGAGPDRVQVLDALVGALDAWVRRAVTAGSVQDLFR